MPLSSGPSKREPTRRYSDATARWTPGMGMSTTSRPLGSVRSWWVSIAKGYSPSSSDGIGTALSPPFDALSSTSSLVNLIASAGWSRRRFT